MRPRVPSCFLVCVVGVVLVSGCATGDGSAGERLTHQTDPDAVQAVLAGQRDEASAAWWGFDERDSTASLQAAIRSGARKLIVPNLGKPWIVQPLFLESDQEIVLEDGVVILARAGAFRGKGDSLLTARDKENITLRGFGASLVMRKQDYRNPPYAKSEWRHCLSLRGCRNVRVYGLRTVASGGDGIYLGRGTGDRIHCQDITIKDVTCEDHYRQGISVISAENLLIEGCTLRGTEGTAPQAGIDFEPNHPDEHLANCMLRECVIEHNAGYGILMYLGALGAESEPVSITVDRCRVGDNGQGALGIHGAKRATGLRGRIRLRGNTFDGKQALDEWAHLEIQITD
jgi:polygalacturonase